MKSPVRVVLRTRPTANFAADMINLNTEQRVNRKWRRLLMSEPRERPSQGSVDGRVSAHQDRIVEYISG